MSKSQNLDYLNCLQCWIWYTTKEIPFGKLFDPCNSKFLFVLCRGDCHLYIQTETFPLVPIFVRHHSNSATWSRKIPVILRNSVIALGFFFKPKQCLQLPYLLSLPLIYKHLFKNNPSIKIFRFCNKK